MQEIIVCLIFATWPSGQVAKWYKYCAPSDATIIVHVFFEVYLPVSAHVLSGTRLPRFPDQGHLFGGLFGLLIHLLNVW